MAETSHEGANKTTAKSVHIQTHARTHRHTHALFIASEVFYTVGVFKTSLDSFSFQSAVFLCDQNPILSRGRVVNSSGVTLRVINPRTLSSTGLLPLPFLSKQPLGHTIIHIVQQAYYTAYHMYESTVLLSSCHFLLSVFHSYVLIY